MEWITQNISLLALLLSAVSFIAGHLSKRDKSVAEKENVKGEINLINQKIVTLEGKVERIETDVKDDIREIKDSIKTIQQYFMNNKP